MLNPWSIALARSIDFQRFAAVALLLAMNVAIPAEASVEGLSRAAPNSGSANSAPAPVMLLASGLTPAQLARLRDRDRTGGGSTYGTGGSFDANQNNSPYDVVPNGNGLGTQPNNFSTLDSNASFLNGPPPSPGGIYDRVPSEQNGDGSQSGTYSTLDSDARFLGAPPPVPPRTYDQFPPPPGNTVVTNGNGNYGVVPPAAPGQQGYDPNAAPPNNYADLPGVAGNYGAAPPPQNGANVGTAPSDGYEPVPVRNAYGATNLSSPDGTNNIYGTLKLSPSVNANNATRPKFVRTDRQLNLAPSATQPQRQNIYGAAPVLPANGSTASNSAYGALPLLQDNDSAGPDGIYGAGPAAAPAPAGAYGAVPNGQQNGPYGAIPTGNPNGTAAFSSLQTDTQLLNRQRQYGDTLPDGSVFLPPPPAAVSPYGRLPTGQQAPALGAFPLPAPVANQRN